MSNDTVSDILQDLGKARLMVISASVARKPQLSSANANNALMHLDRAISKLKARALSEPDSEPADKQTPA